MSVTTEEPNPTLRRPPSLREIVNNTATAGVVLIFGIVATFLQILSSAAGYIVIAVGLTAGLLALRGLWLYGDAGERRWLGGMAGVLFLSGAAVVHGVTGFRAGDREASVPDVSGRFVDTNRVLRACHPETIAFTAQKLPPGFVYMVGQRDGDTPNIHFFPAELISGEDWSSAVSTGEHAARFWLLAMPEESVEYFTAESTKTGERWRWYASRLPITAKLVDPAEPGRPVTYRVEGDCPAPR